ncbi:alpha/beta hydrolase [Pseudomonas japonica]|uniref:alpha/beta hydrolase n=1 Tax=Pseudomonas japonica TaxID=256466 RepID=UPI0015E407AA|nr:alpha/beta fold hydrolase [Pseudomonas japonica]MBA1242394.1 alpha/beta fold hydrolase [Pseudomonas japonica]
MTKWLAALLFPLIASLAHAQPVLQHDLPLSYLAQAGANPQAHPLIIFLHGYGANEEDLFEIHERLFPDFTYLSVRAPMPLGEGRYQWFSKTPDNGPYEGVPAEVQRSLETLRAFVTEAGRKYKVAPRRIYLVGFSQGAMMSYELALQYPDSVGGIAALSGKLTSGMRQRLAPLPGLAQLPVFIGHGTADPILPYAEATQANEALLKVGIKADFHAYPGMTHGVSKTEVDDLAKWLFQVTGIAASH